MINVEITPRKLKILDFDIEVRPLAWYSGDFVTKQPTGIGWKWIGVKVPVTTRLIGESFDTRRVLEEEKVMIEAFREAYDEADIVTGHFIRDFDLRTLDGACIRLGIKPLGQKLTICTKEDFHKTSGLSRSMQNLSAMFEAQHQKFPMNTALWAKANMLLPEGIALTRQRLIHDVKEHEELFTTMRQRGLLRGPQWWTPAAGGRAGRYHA